MAIRRAFFRWQFVAAVALPLWVLVGWATWGVGTTGFLGVALVAPVILVAELVLAGLFSVRGSVRTTRALGWPEIAALSAFHLSVIGAGFFTPATPWLAVLAVVTALIAFWVGVRVFLTDVRARVRENLRSFGGPSFGRGQQQPRPTTPINGGEYIVLPRQTPNAPSH
jgi:hypothetical protein